VNNIIEEDWEAFKLFKEGEKRMDISGVFVDLKDGRRISLYIDTEGQYQDVFDLCKKHNNKIVNVIWEGSSHNCSAFAFDDGMTILAGWLED
jgi:hypothetical protein